MAVIAGSALPDVLHGTILADTLTGLAADDLLHGFDAADLLAGGAGDDILYGGSGDDTLEGGAGEDLIYGQSGNDLLSYASATTAILLVIGDPVQSTGDAAGDVCISVERIALTAFNDTLVGSDLADRVEGGNGDDLLQGLLGNDVLQGGNGNDSLGGGLGTDTLDGGAGHDFASYADSVDNLRLDFLDFATSSPEVAGDVFLSIEGFILGFGHDLGIAAAATAFAGGAGDDTLLGSAGADWLAGDAGQDMLSGNAGNDRIDAGSEPDPAAVIDLNPAALGAIAFGGLGHDTLTGGNMADDLAGDAGHDSLSGGDGNDLLFGGAGNDRLTGDAGDDRLNGGAGRDVLTGGIGTDTAVYATTVSFIASGSAQSTGEALGDTLTGIERLEFQGAGSTYTGATGAMALAFTATGGRFRAGLGAETVTGNGTDTSADYSAATRALVFTTATGQVAGTGGHAAGDRLAGVTQLTLGDFNDRITLTAAAAGLAQVAGGGGADLFLLSGSGVALAGGTGNDSFRGSFAGGTRTQPITLAGEDGADSFQIWKATGSATDWVLLDGGAGDDTLTAQNTGGLRLHGSVAALGGDGNDLMTLRADRVQAAGDAGNDTITATGWGIDASGGDGDDRITLALVTGSLADSTLAGGAGDDVLAVSAFLGTLDPFNRTGELRIDGGTGQDSISGTSPLLAPGSGALLLREVFVFAPGSGNDTVAGFDDGTDLIAFATGGPLSLSDLTILESPTGTLISWGNDSLALEGIAPADLSAADFLFA